MENVNPPQISWTLVVPVNLAILVGCVMKISMSVIKVVLVEMMVPVSIQMGVIFANARWDMKEGIV